MTSSHQGFLWGLEAFGFFRIQWWGFHGISDVMCCTQTQKLFYRNVFIFNSNITTCLLLTTYVQGKQWHIWDSAIHPVGRSLFSDWFVNSFTLVVYEKIFLFVLWTEKFWQKKCFLIDNHYKSICEPVTNGYSSGRMIQEAVADVWTWGGGVLRHRPVPWMQSSQFHAENFTELYLGDHWAVLVSVNYGCFFTEQVWTLHCNVMRKAIEAPRISTKISKSSAPLEGFQDSPLV